MASPIFDAGSRSRPYDVPLSEFMHAWLWHYGCDDSLFSFYGSKEVDGSEALEGVDPATWHTLEFWPLVSSWLQLVQTKPINNSQMLSVLSTLTAYFGVRYVVYVRDNGMTSLQFQPDLGGLRALDELQDAGPTHWKTWNTALRSKDMHVKLPANLANARVRTLQAMAHMFLNRDRVGKAQEFVKAMPTGIDPPFDWFPPLDVDAVGDNCIPLVTLPVGTYSVQQVVNIGEDHGVVRVDDRWWFLVPQHVTWRRTRANTPVYIVVTSPGKAGLVTELPRGTKVRRLDVLRLEA